MDHKDELDTLAPGVDCSTGDRGHVVQFYETDAFLLDAIRRFIGPALEAGGAAVVIATEAHREGLAVALRAAGLDLDTLRARGQYVALDARETLSRFLVDDWPDRERFNDLVGGMIARLAERGQPVCAFGEMVAL